MACCGSLSGILTRRSKSTDHPSTLSHLNAGLVLIAVQGGFKCLSLTRPVDMIPLVGVT